jgi:hypothetical protein
MRHINPFTQQAFIDVAGMLGDSLVDADAAPRIDEPLVDLHILLEDRDLQWFLLRWLHLVNWHGLSP